MREKSRTRTIKIKRKIKIKRRSMKKLNSAGAEHAAGLIGEGKIKESESWAPPSAERENSFIQEHGMGEFGKWHLGVDLEADAQSKGRYGFIFTSDFKEVDYA